MVSLIRSGNRYAALTRDLPLYVREDYRYSRSGRRKLTQAQVKDIVWSPVPQQTLMEAYKIDRRTVERIRRGELHRHLTEHLARSNCN